MNRRRVFFGIFVLLAGSSAVARGDDWPQWQGPKRDGVWRESGIVERFPANGPRVLWRTPIGAGYSGPAVADGRVYVTDRVLKTGAANPGDPFQRTSIPGMERVICLDETNGKVLWSDEYPCAYTMSYAAGPRATPVVADGKVYTFGGEGDLRCYDAKNGKKVWSTSVHGADATAMWGFAASPLVEGNRVICLGDGKDAVVVAFNKDTGKPLWKALNAKEPGYSAPIIVEAGGTRQLIVWHPEALVSLNPQTGETYWSEPFPVNMGLSIATARTMGDLLYVTCQYDGSLMMRLDKEKPAATRLWQHKGKNERVNDGLQALMCSPLLREGYIYGVTGFGQLRCFKADTEQKVWETLAPTGDEPTRWANAFITPIGDQGSRCVLANEHGDLILANLSPKGYEEISRAHVIEPTNNDAQRPVVWSHPAYADHCAVLRNDKEIIRVSLAAEDGPVK